MPRIPLEDNFTDVIAKAQRGRGVSNEQLAERAEVSMEDLLALKAGKPIVAVLRRVARHLRLHPDALEDLAMERWYPEQPVFTRGFFMSNTRFEDITVNSYALWDPRSRQAALFDTGADATDLIELVQTEKLVVQHIFVTHSHEDHILDLERLHQATHADVWLHEAEPLPEVKVPVHTFKENAFFHIGSLAIKTLLTSGHSPGQTSYFVTGLSWPIAVCGDSMFAGSCGGSATHFTEQLHNNTSKLLNLQRDTVLAPGHGPLTTVTEERRHNPFFAT